MLDGALPRFLNPMLPSSSPTASLGDYTPVIQQIEEGFYEPLDAEYWRKFPMRPCRWGMARDLSNRLKAAFAGDVSVADGKRWEGIMAKKLGR
jgi:hypothetical protein